MEIFIYILIYYLNVCYCSDFKNLNEHVKNQFDKPPWEKSPLKYDLNDSNNLVLDVLSSSVEHLDKNTDESENICTLSYSPEHSYLIREVTEGNNLVWRCSGDFESAKSVELVQKKGLTQLVSVKNNQSQSFFKRQKAKFVQVSDSETFRKLQKSLEEADYFVDKSVELDLTNPVPSRSFFTNDLVYVDGVPKFTVRTLKHLDLFRVFDSQNRSNNLFARFSPDTLWTHDNNVRCDSLSMYMFDEVVLLHLVLADSLALLPQQEHKYFKKEDGMWHSMGSREFHAKFGLLKSKVKNVEVSFDLNLEDKMVNVFYRKSKKLTEEPELTLYPKTGYHLKKLLYNGTEISVLGENERFSPLELYMNVKELVLVRAHVWKDRTEFKNLNFKKTDRGFVSVDDQEFETSLNEFRSKPTVSDDVKEDLDLSSDDESDVESSSEDEETEDMERDGKGKVDEDKLSKKKLKESFYLSYFRENNMDEKTRVKFNVKFNIDEKYFKQQKSMDGDFEVHNVTPKEKFLVNLVDSKQGVVWKATDENLQVKSLLAYFKEDKCKVLKLNVVGPVVNKYKYYVLSNNRWNSVSLNSFYKALNKDEQSLQVLN